MREWDPIGIADCRAARDEYRTYAAALDGMLKRGAGVELLQEALLRFERDAMGLRGNVPRARRVAAWLVALADD